MSLREEFEKSVEMAAGRGGGRGRFTRLHYAIGGPPRSGKTTHAFEYIDMLRQEKVITGQMVHINFGTLIDEGDAETALRDARNGVLLVDEVAAPDANRPGQRTLRDGLKEAIVTDSCIVVLIGEPGRVNSFFGGDDALKNRMLHVSTDRTFTEKEMEEYERQKEEEKHRWDPDIVLKNPVKMMKALRLTKGAPV